MRARTLVVLVPAALAAFVLPLWAGCIEEQPSLTADASTRDGAGFEGSSIDVPGAVPVTQRGQIIVARQNTPVEGAIVSTSAGSRTSTDDGGLYSIQVPKGVAYSMTVEKQGFWKLVEQEWIIDQDTDRKDTSFLSEILASLLAASIPDLDATKGVLTLRVYPTEGCPSVEGATVSIEPAGGKLVYPRGGLPSKETTIAAEESPSAIFYNLPTGVPLQLKASHPTCTFVPYPAKADGFTYTGKVTTEPGKVISFARVFLKGNGVSDAGADAPPTDASDAAPE